MISTTYRPQYHTSVFAAAAFMLGCFCIFVFHVQLQDASGVASDLGAHVVLVEEAGRTGGYGYSLLHFLLVNLGHVSRYAAWERQELYPLFMMLALGCATVFTTLFVRSYLRAKHPGSGSYLVDFLAISVVLVSMIVVDPWSPPYYLGVGSPNPWHNPTYIFCKPFSVLVVIGVLRAYDAFRCGVKYGMDLILIAAASVLSMWAKPSFMMTFLPACFLVFTVLYWNNIVSFRFLILLGMSLATSLIPFFVIWHLVYDSPTHANKIILTFGKVLRSQSDNLPLSFLMGLAFPVYVYVVNVRKLKLKQWLLLVNLVVAYLLAFFIAEEGDRMYHGNFAWGYLFAMFFAFLLSMETFFLDDPPRGILFHAGWLLFLAHLISGVFYVAVIALGWGYR